MLATSAATTKRQGGLVSVSAKTASSTTTHVIRCAGSSISA